MSNASMVNNCFIIRFLKTKSNNNNILAIDHALVDLDFIFTKDILIK